MLLAVAGDERDWVAGLRAGDPAAFDAVYDCYSARIYTFLVRMTGRPAVAEDLAQETWLRLAKHARRLREDSELGAWLYTVARNLARSHRRWVLLDPLSFKDLRTAGPDDSPLLAAVAGQTQAQLESALAALPIKYREVLLLVVIEAMTPTEAAAVLDRKPETVRQQLARARAKLREQLETNAAPVKVPVT